MRQRVPLWVNRVTLTTRRSFPVFPDKQTCSEVFGSVTPPVLVDSVLKPSGIRGSSPSAGWLQVGQGMPAAHTDHFQLPAPSNSDDKQDRQQTAHGFIPSRPIFYALSFYPHCVRLLL
jgi:hypothetical protein